MTSVAIPSVSIPAYQTTILGCPLTSLLDLYSTCSATNIPACATATPEANWGADCCGSLYAYGTSVAACYSAHAPSCLDTAAAYSSLTAATASGSNVCAAYYPGSGSGGSQTTGAAATATGTTAAGGATAAATAAATAGSAAGSASPSATGKSAAPKIGAGLKVYVGAALIGALAVLSL